LQFFRKKGFEDVPTIDSLFKEITGFEYPGVPVEAL
jgi:hypothetical protein